MFAMFALTFTSFSQSTITQEKLHKKYNNYLDLGIHFKPLSYDEWKLKHQYDGGINDVYKSEEINLYSKSPKEIDLYFKSPGTYLIKAQKQMITGIGCQIFAGILVVVAPQINGADTEILLYGAGFMCLFGLGLEISGINNIGKAGVSFNENGVGIKLKF